MTMCNPAEDAKPVDSRCTVWANRAKPANVGALGIGNGYVTWVCGGSTAGITSEAGSNSSVIPSTGSDAGPRLRHSRPTAAPGVDCMVRLKLALPTVGRPPGFGTMAHEYELMPGVPEP